MQTTEGVLTRVCGTTRAETLYLDAMQEWRRWKGETLRGAGKTGGAHVRLRAAEEGARERLRSAQGGRGGRKGQEVSHTFTLADEHLHTDGTQTGCWSSRYPELIQIVHTWNLDPTCPWILPPLPLSTTLPPLPLSTLNAASPPSVDPQPCLPSLSGPSPLPALPLSTLDSTSPSSLDPRLYPHFLSLPSTQGDHPHPL